MDLKGILAISGYGGLFKLVKQTKTGFIVESLSDGKRMQAFASSKISTLADIAIYTESGETPLKELFKTIFEKKNQQRLTLTNKSKAEDLKNFLEEVLPDYDKERVYVSDIKKIVAWYNILTDNNLIDLDDDEVAEEQEDDVNDENKKSDTKDDNSEDK